MSLHATACMDSNDYSWKYSQMPKNNHKSAQYHRTACKKHVIACKHIKPPPSTISTGIQLCTSIDISISSKFLNRRLLLPPSLTSSAAHCRYQLLFLIFLNFFSPSLALINEPPSSGEQKKKSVECMTMKESRR
jgi:hypothetical protein